MSQVLYELYQKYGREEVLQGGFQVLYVMISALGMHLKDLH